MNQFKFRINDLNEMKTLIKQQENDFSNSLKEWKVKMIITN